ncbi:MAG: carboxypeptidase [Acidobacteriota bacterium]|nr:carboxypeptidase [Acidobacteriota bacterium]
MMVLSFGPVKTSLYSEVKAGYNPGFFEEARYFRVYFNDLDMAHKIVISMDAVESNYEKGYVIVEVTNDEEYNRLLDAGLELEEVLNPMQGSITGVLEEGISQVETIPSYPCYRTVEETFATAASIAANYPTLATWTDYGDSWDKINGFGGYDMMVLKLTNSAITGSKPKIFFTAAMHAREYTTAELVTRLAEYLVANYGADADVTWMLDHHEVHMMLQANPDGCKKAETGLSWRKNTNQNYCGATSNSRGADLNRNFAFKWGCCGGSSGLPCDLTYRGPSAASEPETQIVQDYMAAQFPDQRGPLDTDPAPSDTPGIYIDIHSSGRLVLWPWGWTTTTAPNATSLQTFGRKLAYFNSHSPKQSVGLYITDGTTIDHIYGQLGIATVTIELGTAFFESCTYFENTLLPANMPTLLYAVKTARTPYMTPAGPDAINVALNYGSTPIGVPAGASVTLSASINDTRYNNTNGAEPTQNIAAAEYYIDTPPWVTDPTPVALAMSASDGAFNSTIEAVTAAIDTTGWSEGNHILFVRGQDVNNNWGAFSAVFLYINNTGDTEAPTPNPMTWAVVPTATGPNSITMTATTATDPSGVEYYFECLTAGGHSSSWQASPTYTDTGLTPVTSYTYRVKARDKYIYPNETGWSTELPAETQPMPEWTVLTYDDFEVSFGNYTDGGGDCALYTGGSTYAHQGTKAVDIQDNSGTASAFYHTAGIDVHTPGYTQIKVEFWFKAASMETGEDFWVQYYNGSTWTTVATYVSGTGFSNGVFYNKTVLIDETAYTFPTGMKIRFMCDAGDNYDDVYIDEVKVSAKL